MGKTKKWIKNLFTGKDDKEKKPSSQAYSLTVSEIFTGSASVGNPVPPPPESPKEKQGLSSRRLPPRVPAGRPADHAVLESRIEQKKALAVAVAAATAKLVGAVAYRRGRAVEEAAAVKIQSVFRSYLARKALKALKGLVKVQALVRGYLVRKQTMATLHCMQSLATAQARARSQRIRMADESNSSYRIHNHKKSVDRRSRQSSYQEINRGMDGNIRIVKMDVGESKRSTNSRKSRSIHPQTVQTNPRTSKGSVTNRAYSKQERRDSSLRPSALVDSNPRARSMRFDDYYFDTAQSSPQYSSAASMSEYPSYAQTYHRVVDSSPRAESRRFDDHYLDTAQSSPHASSTSSKPEYPSYNYNMTAPAYITNTESLRAKGERSQSATWARPDSTAGMSKKAPRAGTRPDSNVDPWLAKHARVGGSTGKERDYGSSRTGHTNTVNGKSRSSWK